MIPAPFRLDVAVPAAWTDYNDHLTESAYLLVAGESSDAFFRFIGVDDGYRAAGRSLYTVETHLRNLREAREGDTLSLTLQVLGADAKRLHIVHEIYGPDGDLLATAEQMLLHVDMNAGRTAPFPPAQAARLAEIVRAHADLKRPAYLCSDIGIPEAR
jgi:acyl-CoA thioester hydrolase